MLGHKNLDDNSAYRKFLIEAGTGQDGFMQSPVEEAIVKKTPGQLECFTLLTLDTLYHVNLPS